LGNRAINSDEVLAKGIVDYFYLNERVTTLLYPPLIYLEAFCHCLVNSELVISKSLGVNPYFL